MGIVILLLISFALITTAFALNASANLPLWQQLVLAFLPQLLMSGAVLILDRWEPAQLLVHHLLGWLSNRVSVWDFTSEYQVRDSRKGIQQATSIILGLGKAELWQDDPLQKVIHTPAFTVRLYLSPSVSTEDSLADRDVLYCKLTDMHIPYRQSRRMLFGEILPLFQEIERTLQTNSPTYEMRIAFGLAKNPYYGFFVRRVPEGMMRDFALEFDIPIRGQTHSISVTKNDISVVAGQPLSLIELAMHYLSYSSSPVPSSSSS